MVKVVNGYQVELGEEPRVRDLDLGERLGYERPRAVRDLITRLLRDEKLNDSDVRRTVRRTVVGVVERDVEELWLNERAALKVVAKSETQIADAILDEVIEVFLAVRRGALHPDRDEHERLRQLVAEEIGRQFAAMPRGVRPFVDASGRPLWSEGAAQLFSSGLPDEAIAARAGVTAWTVRSWRLAKARPSVLARRAVRQAFGVEEASWNRTGGAVPAAPGSMLQRHAQTLEQRRRDFEDRVLNAIDREQIRSVRALRRACGGKNVWTGEALRTLLERGVIERAPDGLFRRVRPH